MYKKKAGFWDLARLCAAELRPGRDARVLAWGNEGIGKAQGADKAGALGAARAHFSKLSCAFRGKPRQWSWIWHSALSCAGSSPHVLQALMESGAPGWVDGNNMDMAKAEALGEFLSTRPQLRGCADGWRDLLGRRLDFELFYAEAVAGFAPDAQRIGRIASMFEAYKTDASMAKCIVWPLSRMPKRAYLENRAALDAALGESSRLAMAEICAKGFMAEMFARGQSGRSLEDKAARELGLCFPRGQNWALEAAGWPALSGTMGFFCGRNGQSGLPGPEEALAAMARLGDLAGRFGMAWSAQARRQALEALDGWKAFPYSFARLMEREDLGGACSAEQSCAKAGRPRI